MPQRNVYDNILYAATRDGGKIRHQEMTARDGGKIWQHKVTVQGCTTKEVVPRHRSIKQATATGRYYDHNQMPQHQVTTRSHAVPSGYTGRRRQDTTPGCLQLARRRSPLVVPLPPQQPRKIGNQLPNADIHCINGSNVATMEISKGIWLCHACKRLWWNGPHFIEKHSK